jgi:hypothetical protein
MDIQHYNFRLFYKKGSLHLDADDSLPYQKPRRLIGGSCGGTAL